MTLQSFRKTSISWLSLEEVVWHLSAHSKTVPGLELSLMRPTGVRTLPLFAAETLIVGSLTRLVVLA